MPDAPDELDWSLLARYVAGELSAAERKVVERWYEADPAYREALDQLRAVWDATGGETSGWDTEGTLVELRRRAEEAGRRRPAARSAPAVIPAVVPARRRSWVAWAAGIAALFVGAVTLTRGPRNAPPTAVELPPVTDITTRRAQQAEVWLADGTRVTLGPESHLSYQRAFGQEGRRVRLDGEAYFDVVHDSSRPFEVETEGGLVRDVGTSFVVTARHSPPASAAVPTVPRSPLRVMVATGAVVLRAHTADASPRDSLVLTRGQLGRVLSDGRLALTDHVSPDSYLAWTRGELVFDNASLAEVAEELSRWYDADVGLADPALASRHFSGRFTRKTLDQAVRLVASVVDVSVTRTPRGWNFR